MIRNDPQQRQVIILNCLGCRIANHIEPNVQVVYENEFVTCVLDCAPFNEGHILILPKVHYDDLDQISRQTLAAIMDASVLMSSKLKLVFNPDGITICQNGGVFNDLSHYHMHVIPRHKGDGFGWSEPLIAHHAETRLQETRERIARTF
ncbi:HIT family protein [Paenibacillus taiwanensis]|uniref:HIT family protein n=1 Tax=Paenibacillus taiwanensis TaxID=401638 RepID=UPI000688FFD6|nr:HIT family protein [Paenibacillus taiwanensis]